MKFDNKSLLKRSLIIKSCIEKTPENFANDTNSIDYAERGILKIQK